MHIYNDYGTQTTTTYPNGYKHIVMPYRFPVTGEEYFDMTYVYSPSGSYYKKYFLDDAHVSGGAECTYYYDKDGNLLYGTELKYEEFKAYKEDLIMGYYTLRYQVGYDSAFRIVNSDGSANKYSNVLYRASGSVMRGIEGAIILYTYLDNQEVYFSHSLFPLEDY